MIDWLIDKWFAGEIRRQGVVTEGEGPRRRFEAERDAVERQWERKEDGRIQVKAVRRTGTNLYTRVYEK